jgi:flap endonuclease-1
MRTSRLTSEMLRESKDLLRYMGMPCIQAPSEGEAQCVRICTNADAWAVGSQDYDSLLLGSPRLIRGMTLSGTIELSMITLEKALAELGITREQLVDLAILVGTDFNDGVKGIGPKKALKAVKEGKIAELRSQVDGFDEIKEIFMDPDVTDEYGIEWGRPDRNAAIALLCKEHEFSEDRVNNAFNNLEKYMKEFSQKDLSAWF